MAPIDTNAQLDYIKRQIWGLVVAKFAFKDVTKACEAWIETGDESEHPLYPIVVSGIVITYTKSFTDSKGLPKIGSHFEKFAEDLKRPLISRCPGRKHVVENEVRSRGGTGHRFEEIAGQK